MKYEWRKKEQEIYLPPKKPVIIDIPRFKYFTINGSGNPNSASFGECIENARMGEWGQVLNYHFFGTITNNKVNTYRSLKPVS